MKKMYRVYEYSTAIEEIEIAKESEHTLWYFNTHGNIVSERKNTSLNKHFDTHQDAKDYLISKYTKNLEFAKRQVAEFEEKLNQILTY